MRRAPGPSSASHSRWAKFFGDTVIALSLALPLVNSATVLRAAPGPPIGALLNPLLVLYVGTVLFTLGLGVLLVRERRRVSGVTLGGLTTFLVLLGWLVVSHLRTENFDAARNLALVAAATIALVLLVTRGYSPASAIRGTFRIAILFSIAVWVLWPVWYVNKSQYFVDSGKIVSDFPNVQGLLSHPNFTGLYFSCALVIEFAMWRRGSRRVLSLIFISLSSLILVSTQGRNAILAAILACIVVIVLRRGNEVAPRLALIAVFAASLAPLIIIVIAFTLGNTPSFRVFDPFTNRGSLWIGIAESIAISPILGSGQNGITFALQFVTDQDVTSVTHAHNQVLTLLVLSGVIGVFLYAVLFFALVRQVRESTVLGAGLFFVVAVSTITETPLSAYVTQTGVAMLLMTTVLLSRDYSRGDDSQGTVTRARRGQLSVLTAPAGKRGR